MKQFQKALYLHYVGNWKLLSPMPFDFDPVGFSESNRWIFFNDDMTRAIARLRRL